MLPLGGASSCGVLSPGGGASSRGAWWRPSRTATAAGGRILLECILVQIVFSSFSSFTSLSDLQAHYYSMKLFSNSTWTID